jgi:hypothetical protein
MKTKNLIVALIGTSLACTPVCIAETVVTENRETEIFQNISAEEGIDVYFTQNDSRSVQVEADKEHIGKIITKIDGETLVIKWDGRKEQISGERTLKVHVSAPELNEVSISRGVVFYAENLNCDQSFQIESSGKAIVHIENLTVDGMTTISTSGESDCNIKNLQTGECKLSASGGSDLNIGIKIFGKLSAAASGGSDIKLSGQAKNVSASASGGSDINVRKLTYEQIDTHKSGGSDIWASTN